MPFEALCCQSRSVDRIAGSRIKVKNRQHPADGRVQDQFG
jgi:hypothetical protein